MLKEFCNFKVGDKVLYSGVTSYTWRKVAVRAPGRIVAIGNSLSIELDEYRQPYYVKDSFAEGSYVIPKHCFASVSVGDLVTHEKIVDKA